MRTTSIAVSLALQWIAVGATPLHASPELHKRATCQLPSGQGLVPVSEGTGGWALEANEQCTSGEYCPYACPSGQLSVQWDPSSTYTYPSSLNGGLLCGNNGVASKPLTDRPYCAAMGTNVRARDSTNRGTPFCQTVLPGPEIPLIPNSVGSTALTLAVPDQTYWQQVAANYYIARPGTSTSDACVSGTEGSGPIGVFSPFLLRANRVSSGMTYIQLGWNSAYVNAGFGTAGFNVAVQCTGSCVGLPCGSTTTPGRMNSATGPNECVVQVPASATATIVVS